MALVCVFFCMEGAHKKRVTFQWELEVPMLEQFTSRIKVELICSVRISHYRNPT
jgi:hypothetical protein